MSFSEVKKQHMPYITRHARATSSNTTFIYIYLYHSNQVPPLRSGSGSSKLLLYRFGFYQDMAAEQNGTQLGPASTDRRNRLPIWAAMGSHCMAWFQFQLCYA